MTRLSPHFTLEEMVRSDYAMRHDIDNWPHENWIINNLRNLCTITLEPVRILGGNNPVIVTSGYRCPELNSGIGGSHTSQHMEGKAADFTMATRSNHNIVDLVMHSDIHYDQLIYEFGELGWIHISFNSVDTNRRQTLEAYRVGGRTRYRPFNPNAKPAKTAS